MLNATFTGKDPTGIPEPGTLALVLASLFGLTAARSVSVHRVNPLHRWRKNADGYNPALSDARFAARVFRLCYSMSTFTGHVRDRFGESDRATS